MVCSVSNSDKCGTTVQPCCTTAAALAQSEAQTEAAAAAVAEEAKGLTYEDWVDQVAAGGLCEGCEACQGGHATSCVGALLCCLEQGLPSPCHLY